MEKQKLTAAIVKGLEPATINCGVGMLKAVFSLALTSKLIATNPLAGVKRLKVGNDKVVRYLSSDEAQRLRLQLAARQDQQRQERERYNVWRAERHLTPYTAFTSRFTAS